MKIDVGYTIKCNSLAEKGECSAAADRECPCGDEHCCLYCDIPEGCPDIFNTVGFIAGLATEKLTVYTDTLRPTIERAFIRKEDPD